MIALCPAIAVSDLSVNSIGLGVAALLASSFTALAASVLRRLPRDLRWQLCVLSLAALLSCIALWMRAWTPELHSALGIFLPLLAANLAIQWRAEQTASVTHTAAVMAGLRTGAMIAAVLLLLALARELVGRGSLLHDIGTLPGGVAGGLGGFEQQLFRADMGFLLAVLPPGAFISFGLLLAVRNWIGQRKHD